jgi:hypothetical protein
MRAWSDRPFDRVTPLAEVAAATAEVAGENGESTAIYECAGYPGWLVKRYKPGFPEESPDVLDRLIELPGAMNERDRAVVDESICWPVSRVVSGEATVGVLLAKAPAEFFVKVETPFGPPEAVPLNLDQLVQSDPDFYRARAWGVPDLLERMKVARGMLRVGVLFERHDVVYGDWSYANLFWARRSGRVFVIDVDACGLSSRSWVECNTWNDPAVAPGERLTVHTDRYKLAVAVLRSLTGVRGEDPRPALEALAPRLRTGPLGEALYAAITAAPELRPGCMELLELLESELDDMAGPRPHHAAAPPPALPSAGPSTVPSRGPSTAPSTAPSVRSTPGAALPAGPQSRAATQADIQADMQADTQWVAEDDRGPGLERLVLSLIVACLAVFALLVFIGIAAYLFH